MATYLAGGNTRRLRSFQLDTPKPRSRKRTYAYLFRSMRTLRFLISTREGCP